nr:MAG TPA: YopX protein [Caudoviricetes sp.]
MKREILFRGKSYYNEWVYGDLRHSSTGYGIAAIEQLFANIRVKPDTIGQYTGLKDCNGNKIFEGDILEYIGKRKDNMNKVYRRKVVFHEGMFALLSKELQAYSALNYHCMKDGRFAWRVIGNIHDNPELIE